MAATLAVGDGANDLPMILEAGLGVAFHAKPVVAAEARARVDYAGVAGAAVRAGVPGGGDCRRGVTYRNLYHVDFVESPLSRGVDLALLCINKVPERSICD